MNIGDAVTINGVVNSVLGKDLVVIKVKSGTTYIVLTLDINTIHPKIEITDMAESEEVFEDWKDWLNRRAICSIS